jgi:hypothetical protein
MPSPTWDQTTGTWSGTTDTWDGLTSGGGAGDGGGAVSNAGPVTGGTRGLTRFGKLIEAGLTRIRESYIISASTPANQTYLIADAAMELVGVQEIHSVAGGSGATLTVEKLTGTTAPGSGTALTGAADLTGTANTMQTISLTGTAAQVLFAKGDRAGVRLAGTLTSLQGAFILIFRRT